MRNYVRNGHGWSQPNVTGADTQAGGRKLPKTPHGAKNAMAALQGMLGINQNNLTNMLGINGSVQNINNSISNVSGLMGGSMMSAAVRRLPQVPPLPAVGLPGQQQQQLLQQQQQQQPNQQSWISKLFHRKSATPQQETNQRLQQQLLLNQQQSNMNQQQILGGQQQQQQVGQHQHQYQQHQQHQQHPGPGYPPVITPAPLPMSASLSQLPANMNLVQQIQLPASNSLQPGGVVPHPPLPPPPPPPPPCPEEAWRRLGWAGCEAPQGSRSASITAAKQSLRRVPLIRGGGGGLVSRPDCGRGQGK